MSTLARFSISLDQDLLDRFDRQVAADEQPTRSKAVEDLIRRHLVEREWVGGEAEVAGSIILVYDHHRRDLTARINAVQHDFHSLIMATQHFHLDHDRCFEIVAVRGRPRDIDDLARRLRAIRGILHSSLTVAASGDDLRPPDEAHAHPHPHPPLAKQHGR